MSGFDIIAACDYAEAAGLISPQPLEDNPEERTTNDG